MIIAIELVYWLLRYIVDYGRNRADGEREINSAPVTCRLALRFHMHRHRSGRQFRHRRIVNRLERPLTGTRSVRRIYPLSTALVRRISRRASRWLCAGGSGVCVECVTVSSDGTWHDRPRTDVLAHPWRVGRDGFLRLR
jgi:hypothetical protein